MEFVILFLYFCVYTGSLFSLFAVILFRSRLKSDIGRASSSLAAAVAITGSTLSIQIFLQAVGLTESLPGNLSRLLTLILNLLNLTGITLVIAASAAAAVKRVRTALYILMGTASAVPAILNLRLYYRFSPSAAAAASISLAFTALFFYIILTASAVYSLIRRKPLPYTLLLWALTLMPLLFFLTDSIAGRLMLPAGLILLNGSSLFLIYSSMRPLSRQPSLPVESDPKEICKERGLSKRETEVAVLLGKGLSYKEIADQLCISMSTTQTHIKRIYTKLSVSNKTELANLLRGKGATLPPSD